ncbi:MAG TPA: type II toxin-antitoxin system VapC family toxin [Pyrinomonadaceae bacterium]|nr:type II toxin-antitoxin system VapC family toxin [Pyrinomonadaceae bacterium]
MTDYVIDASVAIKWFVPEILEAEAKRWLDPSHILYAPELLLSEVGNILWKKTRLKEITEAEAFQIALELKQAPITLISALDVFPDALTLAQSTGRTVYDCMYLAAAIKQGCQLVTADRKFYDALQLTSRKTYVIWVAD